MKTIKILCFLIISVLCFNDQASARTLSQERQDTADTIARVCIENWDEFGVLPSVAVAQAFIESTLGSHCSGYNLWGIRSGAEKYDSLEAGVLRYLEVINNGYYTGAPFETDYRKQLRAILDGGYCVPVGDYYADATWAIEAYGFDKYDAQLFDALEAAERRKEWDDTFTLVHDATVPKHVVRMNRNVVKGGAVVIPALYDIYDVKPGARRREIRINAPQLDGLQVHIRVYENAKG